MRGSIHAGTAGGPGLAWHLGPDIDYLLRPPKGGGVAGRSEDLAEKLGAWNPRKAMRK